MVDWDLTALDYIMTSYEVVFVLTDKKSKAIIERGKKESYKVFCRNIQEMVPWIFF